jgi:hypothetical protein
MQMSIIEEEETKLNLVNDNNLSDEENDTNDTNNSNYVNDNNSTEDILVELNRINTLYNTLNEKIKNSNLELTKDNYTDYNKYIQDINKSNCLLNNNILKKSLKNCISKKNSKKKKNSSVESKRKVHLEILEFMEIESNEETISQKDIMNYISSYIKSQRLIENSGINVKDKNLKFFNIVNKLKILFEFIKKQVTNIEKNKDKIEKLFPDNKIPEYLTYTNLMSYYPYFFKND